MRTPRILVVDDSWTELALMAAPLKEQGYEVITASDGEEAIDKVVSTSPDCVVLDIVMPGQNGFQVCRRNQADAARPQHSRDFRQHEEHLAGQAVGLSAGRRRLSDQAVSWR